MVTLYTTHCPSCRVLEAKLKKANIEYTEVDDKEEILRIAEENHLTTAPILAVDNDVMDFAHAVAWVNNR